MSYANGADVKALAGGFISAAWTTTSPTDDDDIDTFIQMTSGEIDGILASRGAALPLIASDPIAVALRSLTADGALIRALDATWASDAPEGVDQLRKDARARYAAGLAALAAGTHAAALVLATTTTTSAGSTLELDDPGYGLGEWDAADWNPSMAPAFHRGQKL